jgi:hypothetical protein
MQERHTYCSPPAEKKGGLREPDRDGRAKQQKQQQGNPFQLGYGIVRQLDNTKVQLVLPSGNSKNEEIYCFPPGGELQLGPHHRAKRHRTVDCTQTHLCNAKHSGRSFDWGWFKILNNQWELMRKEMVARAYPSAAIGIIW